MECGIAGANGDKCVALSDKIDDYEFPNKLSS